MPKYAGILQGILTLLFPGCKLMPYEEIIAAFVSALCFCTIFYRPKIHIP